jgi:hypothetical protein
LAIWRSGVEAPDLIPAFTAALEAHTKNAKSERIPLSPEVRECLADLDTQLKPAVRVLADWLKQQHVSAQPEDQVAVVEALGRLGKDARPEAELLRSLLPGDRWNARQRVAVSLALFRITGDKKLAFPVLREVLSDLEENSSFYSLVDESSTARVQAARALGVLAENGDERARALILETAKGDENPYVRVAALETLARQQQSNAAAMRGLCALLRNPNSSVRFAAASACGRLGPRAKFSRQALKGATDDENLVVRQAARQALEVLE